jgi:putative chitinase
MKLSEHFTLEELTVTQVRNASNNVPLALLPAIKDTAIRMEEVRELLGQPITVTSGYRSALVNKIVGGSTTSAHVNGRAVDFICPAFGTPLEIAQAIEASSIQFDQLIHEEETWVHISFDPKMRREVLTKRRHGGYVAGLRSDTQTV